MDQEFYAKWPIVVSLSSFSEDTWLTVVESTAFLNDLFDPQLDDEEDFSIRVMVWWAIYSTPESIEEVMGKFQEVAAKMTFINFWLYDDDPQSRMQARIKLKDFIKEFNEDVRAGY